MGAGRSAKALAERQRTAILQLIRRPFTDLTDAFRHLTVTSAVAMAVERVSIWFFDAERRHMVCQDLYTASRSRHERGQVFAAADVPRYFQALAEDRDLAAVNARADPRTAEFNASYLQPLGITSMLDTPIRVAGEVVGILCFEHVGRPRRWSRDDRVFACSVADFVALTITTDRRQQAEASLRQANAELHEQQLLLQEYKRMLDEAEAMAHAGSWSWDVKKDAFTWSDGMYRNHGLVPGAFPPTYQGLLDRVFPRDRSILDSAVRQTLATGKPFDCRHRIVLPGASVHIVRARGQAQRDDQGQVTVLFGTCQDVTSEEVAKRLKSEFISLASHELRTPIAILQGAVQVLLQAGPHGPAAGRREELLQRILAECRHLAGIANDLTEAAAAESGLVPLSLRALDLQAWLPEQVAAWRDTAAQRGVALELAMPADGLPAVLADARRLQRILGVLTDNALKYSTPGLRIGIRVDAVPGFVRFAVSDEGAGIDAESLQRVFEPFYRPDPKAFSERGLGLDLFITREIVRRHGGEIWAESSPQAGTTFTFTIPAVTGGPGQPSLPAGRPLR